MITFCLAPAVAFSDDASWTTAKKVVTIIQLVLLDIGIMMLACW